MMKIQNILDLKVFVFVAETKSFTITADLVGLSRSAVGKIIAKLEESLQHRLIHRTTRVLKLSPEGEIFYEYAVRILKEVVEAEEALSLEQAPQGKLRITVPEVFGRLHVMPQIQQLLIDYPAIEIEVLFSDEYLDLVREGIDVAIRIGAQSDSGLVQKVLAYHQYLMCASPQYLAKYEVIEAIADLKQHECLSYLHEGRRVPWKYWDQDQEYFFAPKGRITLQDTEGLKGLALAGFGVVQLSSFLVKEAVDKGDLQTVLPVFSPPKEPICAVYPSKKYLTPKVRVFIDRLSQVWNGKTV
ncbi:LysR family transcriptional regulator [Ignatzschineria rhizosphaerae]|uniref:LysR family transcriptional regulator n=1 Tax=Ignatzschineria rhizosphaerae TaxID=2923279 RepID=A0ABY3WZ59_9GAMM|nr:LysR family transcriptional regulator [Ignatzschineria rhizosphaerae]UNM95894.1 LysR family transcriptional regulator [Ignatzschineria rhizosphaerae]